MNADTWAFVLVCAFALPATLFWVAYSFTARWWRSVTGRAIWTLSFGLAQLGDISVAYQIWGDDYALRDVVRLSVYTFNVIGLWLLLGSLVLVRRSAALGRRGVGAPDE